MTEGYWYRIEMPRAVFAVVTDRQRAIREAAPIARWAIGKPLGTLIGWVLKKGGRVDAMAGS